MSWNLSQKQKSNEAEQFVKILLKIAVKFGPTHQITSLSHFNSFLCQPWAKFHCHLGPWLDCFTQALDLHVTSHMCKHFIHEGKLTLFNILYQTGSNMFSPAGSMEEFTAELSSSTTCILKVVCRAYKQSEMKGSSRRKASSL